MRHIADELEVLSSVWINQHGAFDRNVANTEGSCGEARVEFGFSVLEESTGGG